MHCWPFLAAGVSMDGKEAPHDIAMAGSISSSVWGAAAHYRHLLQQQQQQLEQQQQGLDAQEENPSDLTAATSPGHRSSEASEHEEEPPEHEDSSSQDVLEKLRQQVANVTARTRKLSGDGVVSPPLEEEAGRGGSAPAPPLSRQQQHALSPQSLLAAASLGHHPASLVPLPQLGVAGYGGGGGAAAAAGGGGGATSPAPPREPAASPVSSTAHSPRQAGAQQAAAWNFEEQFKQLYEIDDNPKRKEFLDELFRFMQNRGSPINRLPIMAKQVLDLYELYNLVVARGGLVEVINKKLWQEIIKGLKLPSSITSAAFTLRTQYMKYLYPWECHKEGLSSPAELQAAVDGNRREGRRSTYSSSSYAELVQRSPLMASQMGGGFGLAGGLPTSLHQRGLSPLSLIGNRPTVPNGTGHPVPPSPPFLPGVRPPMLPTPNDTLMTLWSLYSRGRPGGTGSPPPPPVPPRPAEPGPHHPPHAATPVSAPQCEALNLGVQKNRQDREREARERDHERVMEAERERERYREQSYEQEQEERARKKRARREDQRSSSEEGAADVKPPRMKHMKMCFNTNGVSSFELSMEVENVVYRGVLFATSSPPSLEQRLSPSPAALCNSESIPNLKDPFKLAV